MCELDIIFNFEKAYFILDEFVIGGEVQETSKTQVLKAIAAQDLLQEVAFFSLEFLTVFVRYTFHQHFVNLAMNLFFVAHSVFKKAFLISRITIATLGIQSALHVIRPICNHSYRRKLHRDFSRTMASVNDCDGWQCLKCPSIKGTNFDCFVPQLGFCWGWGGGGVKCECLDRGVKGGLYM